MAIRGVERHKLHGLLNDAAAGLSHVTCVVGEAGMGKTSLTLWAEAASRDVDPRFRTIRVVAAEADTGQPLALVRQLLNQLPGGSAPTLTERLLAGALDVGRSPANDGPGSLAASIVTLLTDAARLDPLLLIVDDLHWVDAASLAVLDVALRRIGVGSLLVLLTSRLPLLLAWPVVIELTGLTASQARSLMMEERPGPIDIGVVADLVDQTGGSPLALRELAALLSPDQRMARAPLPEPLPLGPAGRVSFGSALRPLSARARRATLVAALAGSHSREVMPSALAALGLSPADLDPAVDQHVLLPQSWSFTHPPLRSASHDLARADDVRRTRTVLARLIDPEQPPRAPRRAAPLVVRLPPSRAPGGEPREVPLTDQELKVCLLVAEGNTNRQAAQRLFLSEKTIEYHLRKAMAKAGATNRAELSRLVGEGRLVVSISR